jgi:hypothetical protein
MNFQLQTRKIHKYLLPTSMNVAQCHWIIPLMNRELILLGLKIYNSCYSNIQDIALLIKLTRVDQL